MFGAASCEDCGAASLPKNTLTTLREDESGFYVAAVTGKSAARLKVARVEWRKVSFDEWWEKSAGNYSAAATSAPAADGFSYELPDAAQAASCTDDTWTPTRGLPITNGTTVWTGTEMIVWGGVLDGSVHTNTGGRYNPQTDSWTPTSTANAPAARRYQTAVWTGAEMVVWGGHTGDYNDSSGPAGARAGGDGEGWAWVASSPAPHTGASSHQSAAAPGLHQHYFYGASQPLAVGVGDALVAYVYLDPADPPSQLMLQWNDGSWEHRAYWGANRIDWGADGTQSRRYMGALPAAGQWVRLEVPASQVGLEGRAVTGMAFTLYGGRAAWDRAGK